ncbi:unnamed protein product [marine sediment metagenome]|uniref:Uncharacterized protein n=1 Tax=marine sediment metagenome TaxID=412755 RepID=X1AJ83_9ZZZZ
MSQTVNTPRLDVGILTGWHKWESDMKRLALIAFLVLKPTPPHVKRLK